MPVVLTTMPNFVTQQVQVDFTHDPTSASYTWVDLTSRAMQASYRRGRSYELTQVEAGSGSLTLKNTDGALDPTNGSSAYSPNVIPYRRIQHNATFRGVTYPIFTGIVERWPMTWDAQFGTVPTQCTDTFAILANSKLKAAYVHEVLADSPAAFYPLDDPAGSTSASEATGSASAASIVNGVYGAGTLAFGASTTVLGVGGAVSMTSPDAGTSAATSGVVGVASGRATWLSTTHPLTARASFTVEVWFQGPSSPPAAAEMTLFNILPTSRSAYALHAGITPTTGNINVVKNIGTASTLFTANNLCDGAWHHLLVDVNIATGVTHVYIDGALSTSTTVAGTGDTLAAGPWDLGAGALSSTSTGTVNNVGYMLAGSVSMFALYAGVLSSARVAAHYNAGTVAFVGETADTRISRIISYAGWTGPTSIDTSTTAVLGATNIAGESTLSALQAVATTEGGTLYVAANGTLTFKSRRTRMATASSYTFGDGAGELPYEDVAFDYDPTYVYNDIEITRSAGAAGIAKDATSQGHFGGARTLSQTMEIQSDSEMADAVTWLLGSYKDPHLRVSSITLNPGANATLFPACLSMEIGTRVTVKRRPIPAGNTISADFYVEQVTHDTTPGTWVTTLALSPVALQVLVADSSATVSDSVYVAGY